jgi:molecular chaperone GrpE
MVDNFERAKTSIKTETEGENIHNSYQGIYKQFVEIMKALGVVAVDTVGKEFDPKVD